MEIAESADLIQEMQDCYPLIVVCSDHGYTLLPNDIEIINLEKGDKNKVRSLYTANTDVHELDEKNVWILQKDLFGLNREMAMPLGYRCLDRRPKGATHGGATPQELMVPWIVLGQKDEKEPMERLTFIIEGEIHRRRSENPVSVLVSNPNPYPVTLLELHLDQVMLKVPLPLILPKTGFQKLPAHIDASGVGENTIEIAGRFHFRGPVEENEWDIKLTVQTTGAMSNEFDDDFEL